MNSGKGNRIVLCMGVVALAGVLSNGKTGMAVTKENPLFTEAYKYIQGMEGIETRVLQNRAKARVALLGSEEAPEESLVLFSRTKGLEGTRVYANVNNYVNVRKKATTSSDVVGKLYGGCVATVIKEDENWVYVNSGNVTGYVIKDYLLLGEDAEEAIAKKYTPKIQVTANVLNVRSGAGTGYSVIDKLTKGEEAELLEKGQEWMKIRVPVGGTKQVGYVFAKYVKVVGEPKCGETLAEEKARLAAEKKAAEEAAKKAEEDRKAAIEKEKREKAKQVAEYAKTAVGTAYVWGGTNMKSGVDCSGLCYAAYKKYGYTLPRVSRDMAASSSLRSVTPNKTYLKAGDLVFYASDGRVDHVAMYIGDGKVVHASTYNTGVIISQYNYRTPHSAKRVIY